MIESQTLNGVCVIGDTEMGVGGSCGRSAWGAEGCVCRAPAAVARVWGERGRREVCDSPHQPHPACVRAGPGSDMLTTWQVGHRLSGRRPGWGERRLFTPGRHLLRQMYQVNARIAAFKKKSASSPPIARATSSPMAPRTLTGPERPPPSSTPPGTFPSRVSVRSLSCG